MEFFEAVTRHTFLLNAVLTGVLASVACGIVGTYVVTRRITYLAGGIAHSVLGGMGLARYLSVVQGWSWLTPLHGAIAAALAAAITIGWVSMKAREREDTVIGAVWAIGMAVGVVFISLTPGYNEDLMSYLFGNILMVGVSDLWLIGVLDVVILALTLLFYNQFLAVVFDQEFARLRGVNVEFFYLLLLCMVGLTVVVLVNVVGLILVIALLTLPAAMAGRFMRTIRQTMFLAVLFSLVVTIVGLAVSYKPDLPVSATIILVAGAAYVLLWLASRLRKANGY